MSQESMCIDPILSVFEEKGKHSPLWQTYYSWLPLGNGRMVINWKSWSCLNSDNEKCSAQSSLEACFILSYNFKHYIMSSTNWGLETAEKKGVKKITEDWEKCCQYFSANVLIGHWKGTNW